MKKKIELKKLILNKTRVMGLSADQALVIRGGGVIVAQPKPNPGNPSPSPYPTPQEPPITMQSRVEDCTIVGH